MKSADPGSLVIVSFFHGSLHQELEKLKCVFLFCTTYNWKSLTFCTRTFIDQSRMKLKFTPLIIVAVLSILFGLYFFLSGKGGNLGGLVFIISIFIGSICLLLYVGFRKLFKTKIWKQVLTELLLIILV